MFHYIGLSAVRNTEKVEKKIKTVTVVFYDIALPKCAIDMMETRTIFKNNLRTIEVQIVPKLKGVLQ